VAATPSTLSATFPVQVSATLTGLTPLTTYHFRVNGSNAYGLVNGADMTFTTSSNDASLSSLTLSNGSLSPGFGSGTLYYISMVPQSVDFIKVTPTASDANATIQVQVNADPAVTVASGSPSAPLTLFTGKNIIYVTVTAQDGGTFTTYQITLTRATDFASWVVAKGLSGPNNEPTQDYDNDGVPNLLEYAFGTDPTTSTSGPLVVSAGTLSVRGGPTTLSTTNGSGFPDRYALFARRDDYAFAGLIYTVEFTADLHTWAASPAIPVVVADDGEIQAVTVPYLDTVNGQPVRFFRVKVTAP
jgi:hypothetical protein